MQDKKPSKGPWPTPPFDPRFPNQNQTRNCYQNFLGEPSGAGGGERGETRGRKGHHPNSRGTQARLGSGDRWGGRRGGGGASHAKRGGYY